MSSCKAGGACFPRIGAAWTPVFLVGVVLGCQAVAFGAIWAPRMAGEDPGRTADEASLVCPMGENPGRSGRVWQAQWQTGGEQPVEESLSIGALRLLRSLRRGLRQVGKTLRAAGNQWAEWTVRGLVFVLVIFLAPLVDLALVRTWRRAGFRAARHAAMLGVAVNIRLLVDRRVPVLARLPLVFAVVYGVAVGDLMPDGRVTFGRVDDIVVALVAARLFAALCPDARVAAHARRVAARTGRRSRSQRSPLGGGLAEM